ncbi:unnamed protein product [Phytomonas sp. Hart1]|nr:unnamed protein product [Phytomonas sp. Hart1]|eukprot:CCW69118.1 unnamed protein product [Phytomonas sp. isolate Hart1]
MEEYKTTVDDTPLLVNFLRLIRNGRQEQCDVLSFNPGSLVSFHFGGLKMLDLGAFTEAEDLWSTLAKKASSEGPWGTEGSTFEGPLYLVVTYDDVVIEQWELVDYRNANFENSIPFSCDQLEELNTLVRIIYIYLRVNNIRRYVPQSLLQGDVNKCLGPNNPLQNAEGVSNTENVAVKDTSVKQFLNTIHGSKEEFPKLDMVYTRTQRWCIADLICITVTTNALARTQLLMQGKQSIQQSNSPVRPDFTEIHRSPRRDNFTTQGKVIECTSATPRALIVSPVMCADLTARDRATSSPSGSLKSQCTPSLVPAAALIPTCVMLSPSLLPRLPSNRMAPLSLPQVGCGVLTSIAIKSSTPRETQGIRSPQPHKIGTLGRAPSLDAPLIHTEVNTAAPPDFVRQMSTALFPAKHIKIPQQRLPRSAGIVLDTMAALPLRHDDEDYEDHEEGSMGDSGALHADTDTGGSTFELLELAQRMHTSRSAAQWFPLRDLVLPLNLE